MNTLFDSLNRYQNLGQSSPNLSPTSHLGKTGWTVSCREPWTVECFSILMEDYADCSHDTLLWTPPICEFSNLYIAANGIHCLTMLATGKPCRATHIFLLLTNLVKTEDDKTSQDFAQMQLFIWAILCRYRCLADLASLTLFGKHGLSKMASWLAKEYTPVLLRFPDLSILYFDNSSKLVIVRSHYLSFSC